MSNLDIKVGDEFMYVPGGIHVKVITVIDDVNFVVEDDIGQPIVVWEDELNSDLYRKLG